MSEQQPQPTDPDRENSGGDPAHDPTQDAPASPPVREDTERGSGDDAEDSDGG